MTPPAVWLKVVARATLGYLRSHAMAMRVTMKAKTIGCWIAAMYVMSSGACRRDDGPTPAFVPPSEQNALHEPKPPEPPPPVNKPSSEPPGYPKAGWSKEVVTDSSPVCAFATVLDQQNAAAVQDVRKQTLKANAPVTFGAYAPHCINTVCDDLPSLQVYLEREGKTITLHSRYWGQHKDGATCSDKCLPVKASYNTETLEPGTYTVKHGERSTKLKIPSVLKNACVF